MKSIFSSCPSMQLGSARPAKGPRNETSIPVGAAAEQVSAGKTGLLLLRGELSDSELKLQAWRWSSILGNLSSRWSLTAHRLKPQEQSWNDVIET